MITNSPSYKFGGLPITFVWQPRYWDKKVLINCDLVRPGKNLVVITCDPKYTKVYSYDGDIILREGNRSFNSSIWCYEIPLDSLEAHADITEKMQPLIDYQRTEYEKYKGQRKLSERR